MWRTWEILKKNRKSLEGNIKKKLAGEIKCFEGDVKNVFGQVINSSFEENIKRKPGSDY